MVLQRMYSVRYNKGIRTGRVALITSPARERLECAVWPVASVSGTGRQIAQNTAVCSYLVLRHSTQRLTDADRGQGRAVAASVMRVRCGPDLLTHLNVLSPAEARQLTQVSLLEKVTFGTVQMAVTNSFCSFPSFNTFPFFNSFPHLVTCPSETTLPSSYYVP